MGSRDGEGYGDARDRNEGESGRQDGFPEDEGEKEGREDELERKES